MAFLTPRYLTSIYIRHKHQHKQLFGNERSVTCAVAALQKRNDVAGLLARRFVGKPLPSPARANDASHKFREWSTCYINKAIFLKCINNNLEDKSSFLLSNAREREREEDSDWNNSDNSSRHPIFFVYQQLLIQCLLQTNL